MSELSAWVLMGQDKDEEWGLGGVGSLPELVDGTKVSQNMDVRQVRVAERLTLRGGRVGVHHDGLPQERGGGAAPQDRLATDLTSGRGAPEVQVGQDVVGGHCDGRHGARDIWWDHQGELGHGLTRRCGS